MTAVYIDPGALYLPAPPSFPTQPEAEPVLAPGTAESLRDLTEAGYDVYVIAPPPRLVRDLGLDLPKVEAVPAAPPGTWLVTSDQAECVGRQKSGLRTILIGPRTVSLAVTSVRCDHEARDIHAAVMEILSEDAMGSQSKPAPNGSAATHPSPGEDSLAQHNPPTEVRSAG